MEADYGKQWEPRELTNQQKILMLD